MEAEGRGEGVVQEPRGGIVRNEGLRPQNEKLRVGRGLLHVRWSELTVSYCSKRSETLFRETYGSGEVMC